MTYSMNRIRNSSNPNKQKKVDEQTMSEQIMKTQGNINQSDILSIENKLSKNYIVHIKGLKKYFGQLKAVDGINLNIEKGSIFGFLGPNGAGKTTTINCLITLLRPTDGQGTIAGYELCDVSNIRSKVAGVFQEQTLDEQLSGYQNLDLHARLYHIPKRVRQRCIKELVEMVGLSDRIDDTVVKYSGGMRRRLEIARSFLSEPEILFLDVPSIGLDPQSRSHIWNKIIEVNKDKNITIFITTHHMDEAEALCDQIAIIDQGKIIVQGSTDELKSSLAKDMISVQIKDITKLNESVKRIETIPEVEAVKIVGDILNIGAKDGPKLVATVAQALGSNENNVRIDINTIEIKKPSLNDVFMFYTGKSFRDAQEISLSERLTIHGRKQRNRVGFRR